MAKMSWYRLGVSKSLWVWVPLKLSLKNTLWMVARHCRISLFKSGQHWTRMASRPDESSDSDLFKLLHLDV